MKKNFPKPFITLIALIMVFTGVVIVVHATENTNELTTPVFFNESIINTSESRTNARTTKRTITTQTSYPHISLEVSTNPTSYPPATLPPTTKLTRPQTEAASYVSPLGGYGDGWGHITRHFKEDVNPYKQVKTTNIPLSTNDYGYPVCAQCGDNAWWHLDTQTGELRVYGEGEIYNVEVPQWWDSRDYIKKVVIGNDIINISFFAFADCSQLTEVVIGNSVETIGAFAFSECVNLKSVVIPDSVKSIDSMAFYGCTSLESITMSSNIEHLGRNTFADSGYYNNPDNWEDGVLYIGNCLIDTDKSSLYNADYTIKEGTRVIAAGAFMNSNVKSVVISESVVEIGECAFRWTNMETVEIPQGTKVIRKGAFDCCYDLESIHIPASVKVIEEDAFYGCTALSEITVDENSENFIVDDSGALYTSDKSLLIRFPSQKAVETYTVYENTREIADYAFERSQIKNIVLNDGLEIIGICAFSGCSDLGSVVIPDSVSFIENNAFVWCDNLKSVDLGNAHVSDEIFDYDNSIEHLTLGAGFSGSCYCLNLTSSLKSITVSPDNEYYLSDEYGVLYNKDKTVLYKYPAADERTSYDIPYGVQTIDGDAFSGATNLSEITLPASLTSINDSAFYECSSLRDVYYTGSEEDWGYVYIGFPSLEYIGTPICLDTEEAPEHLEPSDPSWWDETTTWIYEDTTHNGNYPSSSTTTAPYDEEYGTYGVLRYVINNGEVTITDCDDSASGHIVVPDEIDGYTVTKIGERAFNYCYNLNEVTLPNTLTNIGDYAFSECSSITSINIPEGVAKIGEWAFGFCYNLSEVILPNTLTNISNYAFGECSSITSINIPEGVTEIGERAFNYCYNLNEVILPSTLTSIGNNAFCYCESLTSIKIPENVNEIGIGVFTGCYLLQQFTVDEDNLYFSNDEFGVLFNKDKTVLVQYPAGLYQSEYTVPNGVKHISDEAFGNVGSDNIILPEGLLSIGAEAFKYCYSISEIAIPSTVTDIGNYAFTGCTGLLSIIVDPANTAYSSDEYGVLFNKDKTELILYPMGNTRTGYSILDSVIRIGHWSFYNCYNLTNIEIPNSVTEIGGYAFYGCSGLINITIPDSVTAINGYAFCQSGITSIKIPCNVTLIEWYAFEGCENLTDVYFGGTQEDWNAIEIWEGNNPLHNATVHYNANSVARVSAENVTVNKGEKVSVPVIISGNHGFMGFSLIMEYDKTVMTPVSVTAGEILGNGTLNNSIGGNMPEGKLKVMFTADENVMTNGVLFNVEFEIDEKAYGDYDIKLSYVQNDTFNEEFEDVVLSCKSSTINVVDPAEQSASAKFYIEPMQVNAGEEIVVPVYLEVYRGGLSNFDLTLNYNSEIFSFKEFGCDAVSKEHKADDENGTFFLSVKDVYFGINEKFLVAHVTFTVKDYIEGTETITVLCDNAYNDGESVKPFCVNGEITITNLHANEPAIIYTEKNVLIKDGYVDIPVYINNNQGIMGFKMNTVYDTSVIEPVSVTKGALLSNGSFDNNIGIIPGNIKVIWNNTEDINDNGLLYTLRFKVLDNSVTDLPLSIIYSQADTYNEKWEDVKLNIEIGTISIKQEYTATFMADGIVIATQKFTVDTEKLVEPEIPPKAGYIAYWDYYEIKEEDIVINAKFDLPSVFMIAKRTLNVDASTRLLPSCNFETTRKTWSTSNASVAVVDNHGNVTAVGEGKCTIRVTCYGVDSIGNEIKASASTKIVVNQKSESTNLKEKFREAFFEFFEVKLHDFLENLKRFMSVLFRLSYKKLMCDYHPIWFRHIRLGLSYLYIS